MIHMSQLDEMAEEPANTGGEQAEEVRWAQLIPEDQWAVYDRVIRLALDRGLKFALGGGLAFSHYAHRWRNTKDIDLYIKPDDRHAMINVLHETGLKDYFDVKDYDRQWIYRSHNGDGIIVDIIWQMANYRTQVDEEWLTRGPEITEIR